METTKDKRHGEWTQSEYDEFARNCIRRYGRGRKLDLFVCDFMQIYANLLEESVKFDKRRMLEALESASRKTQRVQITHGG